MHLESLLISSRLTNISIYLYGIISYKDSWHVYGNTKEIYYKYIETKLKSLTWYGTTVEHIFKKSYVQWIYKKMSVYDKGEEGLEQSERADTKWNATTEINRSRRVLTIGLIPG